jgi:choline dehydrogenase-like flavoprotein
MLESAWRDEVYDYIVVGSGAGGGPVAANLARAGFSVALIEAGGSDTTASYEVPAFFAEASEDKSLRWDYIVHHYDDPAQEHKDSKAVDRRLVSPLGHARRLHRAPRAHHDLSARVGLGAYGGSHRRRELAGAGHAPLFRAARTL